MPKPLSIMIMGIQASGKGTQAEMLSSKLNLFYFETGKHLREEVKKGTAIGKKIEADLNSGRHVPNEVVDELISAAIMSLPEDQGFILDGTPRNQGQLDRLDRLMEETSRDNYVVVEVKISDQEAINRMSHRLICEGCQKVYRKDPDQDPGQCETCGGKLVRRKDDTPGAIKTRLELSHQATDPVIAEYRRRGRLIEINGEQDIEKVQEDIVKAIDKYKND